MMETMPASKPTPDPKVKPAQASAGSTKAAITKSVTAKSAATKAPKTRAAASKSVPTKPVTAKTAAGRTKSKSGRLKRGVTIRKELRVRLLMAGAFAGALITLALSVAFSWGGPQLSEEAKAAFHASPGSCVMWSQQDASDIRKVDCAQPHLFEVTGVVDISDKYPPSAPAPDVKTWQEIAQERCSDGVKTYLGNDLDPYGKLTVSVLRPSPDDWDDGDRKLRCVLQWAGPGGHLQPLTGAAKDLNQSNVWEPGTCLALAGRNVGDPIDCAQPHAYEIIAKLDLTEKFPQIYPSQSDQKAWLDTQCNDALREYSGGADISVQKLILGWDLREQESWNVGSTQVNCKVGAKLPDNSGLAQVTGSIRQDPEPAAPAELPGAGDSASHAPTSSGSAKPSR